MTYNFDPDTWLKTTRAALEARRDRGEFSDAKFGAELEDLDRRYEDMVARLDGTYEIPSGGLLEIRAWLQPWNVKDRLVDERVEGLRRRKARP